MAMHRHGDLMISSGEFRDSEGRRAKRWHKVGVMMKDDKSGALALKLDLIPVCPDWSGWIAVRNVGEDHKA